MGILKKLFSIRQRDPMHREIRILGLRFKYRCVPRDKELFHHLPIERNKIVFCTQQGAYHCSPKYISEEIRRRRLPYDLVWVVNLNVLRYIDSFPEGVRLVMRGTRDALRELATARIWVENERKCQEVLAGLRKREGQVYIDTWHGSLGIKNTGQQRGDIRPKDLMLAREDAQQVDFLISNATYTTNFYKDVFWGHGQVLEYGCPRNDIFFSMPTSEQREALCRKLGVTSQKKLLLYAPTWRRGGNDSCFNLDYAQVRSALSERFGGEWIILVRLHPFMLDKEELFFPKGIAEGEIVNATNLPDMQELLVVADACITDYSSCVYDYLHTGRPAFIYAPDMAEYSAGRGLCYPLEETPFDLATNNETLVQCIRDFNFDTYAQRVQTFLRGKGCIEDGHATQRVVDLIENIINQNI